MEPFDPASFALDPSRRSRPRTGLIGSPGPPAGVGGACGGDFYQTLHHFGCPAPPVCSSLPQICWPWPACSLTRRTNSDCGTAASQRVYHLFFAVVCRCHRNFLKSRGQTAFFLGSSCWWLGNIAVSMYLPNNKWECVITYFLLSRFMSSCIKCWLEPKF